MASGLSARVRAIENAISMMDTLSDRLKFLQPPMHALVDAVSGMERYRGEAYLRECRERMDQGAYFPEAWGISVQRHAREMGEGIAEILLPLGDVLGNTDLDSQIHALGYTRSLLEDRLEQARETRDRNAKLYRSLGFLGGLGIAIILV